MAAPKKTELLDIPARFADKEELKRLVDQLYEQMGILPGADLSIEELHERMQAEGIRAEDNAFSREIIRMRRGDAEE